MTREDVVKMGKSPEDAVQLPGSLGGGYMGTVEVFHQLHCLVSETSNTFAVELRSHLLQDVIRKYTYLDYYGPKNPEFWGDHLIRMHLGRLSDPSSRQAQEVLTPFFPRTTALKCCGKFSCAQVT